MAYYLAEDSEALEETSWKPWKQAIPINKGAFQKEIIDVWHFLINLTLASEMDAEQVLEQFKIKNKINNERQEKGY